MSLCMVISKKKLEKVIMCAQIHVRYMPRYMVVTYGQIHVSMQGKNVNKQ